MPPQKRTAPAAAPSAGLFNPGTPPEGVPSEAPVAAPAPAEPAPNVFAGIAVVPPDAFVQAPKAVKIDPAAAQFAAYLTQHGTATISVAGKTDPEVKKIIRLTRAAFAGTLAVRYGNVGGAPAVQFTVKPETPAPAA